MTLLDGVEARHSHTFATFRDPEGVPFREYTCPSKEPVIEKGPVTRKASQVGVERRIGVAILISATSRIGGIRGKATSSTDYVLYPSLVISTRVEISRPVRYLRKT